MASVHHVPGVKYAIDPVDGAELVSIPDAAKITQVSVRTVYNWIYRGQVSVRYRPSGRMQVVAETLFRDSDATAGAVMEDV